MMSQAIRRGPGPAAGTEVCAVGCGFAETRNSLH